MIARILISALIGGSTLVVVMDASTATTLPPITHLEVIHDTGEGIPVHAFVGPALKRLEESNAQARRTEPVTQPPPLEHMLKLPLVSRMTPGQQPHTALPEQTAKAMTQGMFVVGADEASQAWLVQNEEWLFQRNSVGYLVQAETLLDVDRMLEAAGRLPLTVLNLDALVGELRLVHYPAALTAQGISFNTSDLEPRK